MADDLKIGLICLIQDGCWAGAKRVHASVVYSWFGTFCVQETCLLLSLCFLPTFLYFAIVNCFDGEATMCSCISFHF